MKLKTLICATTAFWACCSCTSGELSPVDYVDPFIGTGFHGHTYPGATVPFGAVQLSPDTRAGNWDACSGYHYNDTTLKGFSHTHLSGTGCIDLGDILFRPTTLKPDLTTESIYQPAAFSHKDEDASAGYYSVVLKEEGIKAELTVTAHAGMHRYTFSSGKEASIIIDLTHLLDNEYIYEAELEQTAANEITGMRRTRGWTDNQYVYFVAQFSKPFQAIDFIQNKKMVSAGVKLNGTDLQACLSFDNSNGEPVIAKVGLSIVSEKNARENLETEVIGFDFDAVRSAARSAWEQALSAITVKGGNTDDLKNFYTAMYHSMVVPNVVSDVNGEYRRHNMEIGQLPKGKVQYSTFSLWDTFRAWNPLMTLIDTTLVNNMINSFLDIYESSGELPIWPLSAGETGTMIGYHAVSVIADAYMKGIRGFDAEKALEAMVVSSEKNKKGADYYIQNGFIPSNIKKESISCLLEFAYDDWCIARMAQEMTRRLLHEMYAPTPEGIIGNEDCGQMSGWYILSSLGIYSVCPGSNEFALTTPLFEKAVVNLANRKTLTILANNPKKNVYITKVELNGQPIDVNFITYAQLMEGGELRFTLSDKPNMERGVSSEASPYSYTKDEVVSIPYVDKDLNLFMDKVTVALATTTKDAEIRYTLDGSEPTEQSALYEQPFELDKTTLIKAKGFKEGLRSSRTLSISATKAELKAALSVNPTQNGTSYKYFEGTYQKVADVEKSPLLESGVMPEPSIKGAKQEDHFGYIFSGLINVPEDGVYTFQTRSDDGSVLYIHDEQVVNNDASHAAIPATGMVALKKGFHPYKLYYFEDYEGEYLSWAWKLPSAEKLAPIPASALFVK